MQLSNRIKIIFLILLSSASGQGNTECRHPKPDFSSHGSRPSLFGFFLFVFWIVPAKTNWLTIKVLHMTRQILFIQGGGDGGYEADKALVDSLQENLPNEYDIYYPELQTDESVSDFGWTRQIARKILEVKDDAIIVGHSLGASMLLKYFSENPVNKKIKGIFLISTPFWSGKEDWLTGLKLQEDFAGKLPHEVPLFFYHCKDDEVAPFFHLEHYRQKVTYATFLEIETGGHQLNNDLAIIAQDIKSLR